MISLDSTPDLDIQTNLGCNSKTADLNRVNLVVIEPHDAHYRPELVPAEVRPRMKDPRFERFLSWQTDWAGRALGEETVRQIPGSILLAPQHPQGEVDFNRSNGEAAFRFFSRLFEGGAIPEDLRRALLEIHGRVNGQMDAILAAVPPNARVLLLHTMHPCDTDTDVDVTTEAGVENYINRDVEPLRAAFAEPSLLHPDLAFIAGTTEEPYLDNPVVRSGLTEIMDSQSLRTTVNVPYVGTRGVHRTIDAMDSHPERVTCVDVNSRHLVDFPAFLASQSGNYRKPRHDEAGVQRWASNFKRAFAR